MYKIIGINRKPHYYETEKMFKKFFKHFKEVYGNHYDLKAFKLVNDKWVEIKE